MKTNQLIFLFCVSEVIYFSQLMSLSLFVGIGLSFLCIYLKNKQQQISFMLLSSLIIFFNDIYFDGTNQISSYYAYDIIGITLPILLIILYPLILLIHASLGMLLIMTSKYKEEVDLEAEYS